MVIADFEEENPKGIGENNGALIRVEYFSRHERFKEQKGIYTRGSRIKGAVINKEKRQIEDSVRDRYN